MIDVALDYASDREVASVTGPARADVIHLLGRPTELEGWGRLTALPVTYAIDSTGTVRARREGLLDTATLLNLIRDACR
ncbi:MAG: hypothetical protein EB084_11060 [Proteobacteria bacterium]|nr:hypothetical protein [Pseudomonadota bacterium]